MTANTHAATPNIVGATMLGVVASVYTQPKLPIKLDIKLLLVSWISVFEAINSVILVLDD